MAVVIAVVPPLPPEVAVVFRVDAGIGTCRYARAGTAAVVFTVHCNIIRAADHRRRRVDHRERLVAARSITARVDRGPPAHDCSSRTARVGHVITRTDHWIPKHASIGPNRTAVRGNTGIAWAFMGGVWRAHYLWRSRVENHDSLQAGRFITASINCRPRALDSAGKRILTPRFPLLSRKKKAVA